MDDYYEGVVVQYLRADPSMFVRPQSCIQLEPGPLEGGAHWYCDVVAVRLREPQMVFLCEVSFAKVPQSLFSRLEAWSRDWPRVRQALARDNGATWPAQPWVFVRAERVEYVRRRLREQLGRHDSDDTMPEPLVSSLDDITPWRYTPPLQLPLPPSGLGSDASR